MDLILSNTSDKIQIGNLIETQKFFKKSPLLKAQPVKENLSIQASAKLHKFDLKPSTAPAINNMFTNTDRQS